MYQIKIDVATVELLLTDFKSPQRRIVTLIEVIDLGGYKQLTARYSRLSNGVAYFNFVVVHRRSINQAVADFNGLVNGRFGFCIVHIIHAQAQQRHAKAVVELSVKITIRLWVHKDKNLRPNYHFSEPSNFFPRGLNSAVE